MAKLKVELCGMTEDGTAKLIRLAAKAAFARFDYPFDGQVTVTITDDEGIRKYNHMYRQIDKATDVLSFPLNDFYRSVPECEMGELMDPVTRCVPLGDMIISVERAKEQAKEYGHSLEREVCYLAAHGILHCFGYDHIEREDEEEMTALAERIMTKLNLKRN